MSVPSALVEFSRTSVLPSQRVAALRALAHLAFPSRFDSALELERELGAVHATMPTYLAAAKRVLFNLASNPALCRCDPAQLMGMSDDEMGRGTIVERVQTQERERHQAFVDLLREKTDAVARLSNAESVLHCRRCGSSDLHFVQLQTRAAGERAAPRAIIGCDPPHTRPASRLHRRAHDVLPDVQQQGVRAQVAHVVTALLSCTLMRSSRRPSNPNGECDRESGEHDREGRHDARGVLDETVGALHAHHGAEKVEEEDQDASGEDHV